VSDFFPEGYVPAPEAMLRAAEYWFPEQWTALWEAQLATKPDNNVDAAVRAFLQSQITAAWQDDIWRYKFEDIWSQTAHRLRNLLHQATIKAYYFDNSGRQVVERNFWPTHAADGVLETGIYWPFGKPTRLYESRPNYSVFLLESELDALLSELPAKKRPLPRAKMPEVVAALRKLDHLPNRTAQLQALCDMPEFREFKITDALFREAARQAPRDPGRKSRRQS
jgi:hypothetical protein